MGHYHARKSYVTERSGKPGTAVVPIDPKKSGRESCRSDQMSTGTPSIILRVEINKQRDLFVSIIVSYCVD